MSKQQEEFATWLYRTVIGALSSITVFFVYSNYTDFKEMKRDVGADKQAHAVQQEINNSINARIVKLEASAFRVN